jgi:hypothetical protein
MASLKEKIQRNIDKTDGIKKKKVVDFKSTHDLPFETASHFEPMFVNYRVGTCTGIYYSTEQAYVILAISNSEISNGHLQDVFDWFENSCKRDKKALGFDEIINERFMHHLIEKRGFKQVTKNRVLKTF